MNAVLNFNEENQNQKLGEIKPAPLNIYQRLNAVMQDVEYIQKSSKMVNNQYRFVSHDQVVGVLHQPLTKHGIVVIPTIVEHERQGTQTTLKIQVSFVNIDEPADRVDTIHFGYGIDGGDKGIGKAISYAVKYALLKTFCLKTGEDPDYTPSMTTDIAERSALTIGDIDTFFQSTSNEDDARAYISFLESKGKDKYLDIVCRAIKNRESFDKNFSTWQKNRA
jgi:hypothetical protein